MDVIVFSSEYKTEKEDKGDSGIQFCTQKSLDDEHTPGVFNVSYNHCKGGGFSNSKPN